jgi:2-polyprenyl-6-methoxyphenol hydroxylase-like FAD-dependent oxidoreductase
MKRTALARLLADEAIRRGITVRTGCALVGADPSDDGVEAVFDDGSRATGDLLVGADGVRSVTRQLIDPLAPPPRFVGLINFGGITPAGRLTHALEPEAWQFVFGQRAFFGYHLTPGGDALWFANVPRPEVSRHERRTTTEAEWRRQLAELFTQDAGPATDLISSGRLELAGDNTYDLGHVPVWHRGPMIVIGDAAHAPAPTSGQGASLAMEDGVQLARALRDAPSTAVAFASFERLRRSRVERVVAHGARGSSSKLPGRVGRVARDAVLSLILRFVTSDRALGWMYDHRIHWDEPLDRATVRAGPS